MRNQEILSNHRAKGNRSPAIVHVLKGLLTAVAVTLVGIVVFALLMRMLRPSDAVVGAFNQVLKLLSILAGVWTGIGRGGNSGASRGGMIGLLYMALGVALYAMLSGQALSWMAYAADLGMGVAAGGLCGMIFSNLPSKS